jgi:hypothetical protein
MNKKLERETILADLAGIEAMLTSIPDVDLVGRMTFEDRKDVLLAELRTIEASPDTLANVALFFHGKPVTGSRSIEAEFAAKAIEAYQDVVTKSLAASERGGLGRRGPAPAKEASRLNITQVVHGSFGFILEEDNPDSPQLINSSLKETVEAVTDVFVRFAGPADENYSAVVDALDTRVFSAVRNFFKVLHDDAATLRLVEGSHDQQLDHAAIERAYRRAEATDIEDEDLSFDAILVGVVPYARRFELRSIDSGEVLSGKVGPRLSQNYLERIENDEQVIGRKWRVTVNKKFIRKPGNRTQTTFMLIDLEEPKRG